MSTHEQTRRAHRIVDALKDSHILGSSDVGFLRSFLPEIPKQKTLQEIATHVYGALLGTSGNDWTGDKYDADVTLEAWLAELHQQLKGLNHEAEPAAPAHPEFLETEADYRDAPEGTIVACEDSPPWHKFGSTWLSTITHGRNNAKDMTGVIREVLRWSWGNE